MQCSHYDKDGKRCQAEAEVWLYSPDDKRCPGAHDCKEHAGACIREYREKLGQEWYAYEIDWLGNAVPLTPVYRG